MSEGISDEELEKATEKAKKLALKFADLIQEEADDKTIFEMAPLAACATSVLLGGIYSAAMEKYGASPELVRGSIDRLSVMVEALAFSKAVV